ncbi:MAG: ATP-binding protein [Bacteroidales bacterium]|nr:ATP-binding protein [Bacteroidales bacterium]
MEMNFSYKPDIQQIPVIQNDFELLWNNWGVPRPESRQILMIIEELFASMIRNSCPPEREHLVEITLNKNGNVIRVVLQENGGPFNPVTHDRKKPRDLLFSDSGNLGIELIRTFVDSMAYQRNSDRNVVSFQKMIKRSGDKA